MMDGVQDRIQKPSIKGILTDFRLFVRDESFGIKKFLSRTRNERNGFAIQRERKIPSLPGREGGFVISQRSIDQKPVFCYDGDYTA